MRTAFRSLRERPERGDRGAVAIIVVLFLLIFMVLTAFVVDFGRMYASKAQLQNAADAAALAAASSLPYATPVSSSCTAIPANTACVYAKSNGVPNAQTTVNSPPSGSTNTSRIEVITSEDLPTVFGKLFGVQSLFPVARSVAAKTAGPGAPYGFFIANGGTVNGGGKTDFTVTGSPAFIGNSITFTGNASSFQFPNGLYSGSAISTGGYTGEGGVTLTQATADTVLNGVTTASGYANLIGLKELASPAVKPNEYVIDILSYKGAVRPDPQTGVVGVVGTFDEGSTNNWFVWPQALDNKGKPTGYCEINLGTMNTGSVTVPTTTKVVTCDGIARFEGTLNSSYTALKMFRAVNGFDTKNGDVSIGTWGTNSCTVSVVLYSTNGGFSNGGKGRPFLCGYIYLPNGSIDTNGKGIVVKGGRIVASTFGENGNGSTYNVDPTGAPDQQGKAGVALVE